SLQLVDSIHRIENASDYLADRALLHALLSKTICSMPPKISKTPESYRFRVAKPIWLVACAMLLMLGIMVPWVSMPTVQASAQQVLKKTLVANRLTSDRRYSVRVDFERKWSKPSMLWVRNDQFVQSFETAGRKLVWGKSSSGDIWFTIDGHSVAVFQKDEIPAALEDICDLRSLDLRILLESLLKDYGFQRFDRSADRDTITASPKSTGVQTKFKRVQMEIDPNSLLVHKVTLDRAFQGRTLATVNFELQEIATQEDGFYHWKGHVDNDAEVLTQGTRRRLRAELLREFLQLTRISNYR
ncbi:MAG: hypothetical protein ACKOAU_03955, partial [Pirellula sp.]